jgi:hypothetical protein
MILFIFKDFIKTRMFDFNLLVQFNSSNTLDYYIFLCIYVTNNRNSRLQILQIYFLLYFALNTLILLIFSLKKINWSIKL